MIYNELNDALQEFNRLGIAEQLMNLDLKRAYDYKR